MGRSFVEDQFLKLMEKRILATESFATGKRRYFLDFRLAQNQTNYICLVRSDEQADGSYVRNQVTIFEEDFAYLVQAMSSLFHHAAHLGDDVGKRKAHNNGVKLVSGIKSWEPDLRPREKLLTQGVGALADAELLALLIGSGTVKETAVGLASRILDAVQGSLDGLGKADYKFLGSFEGMGMAKSTAIMAGLELGRRLSVLVGDGGGQADDV